MRLYEFQAKRILAQIGIPVPKGRLIRSVEELEQIAIPAVIKAQVLAGGRGKAGAVRKFEDRTQLIEGAEALLGATVGGLPVHALLVEEAIPVKRELYLAYLIDNRTNRPLLMASPAGGMEIEALAGKTPERILHIGIDPLVGIQEHEIRSAAKFMKIEAQKPFAEIVRRMIGGFNRYDATLMEINPLAETEDGGFVALDAKLILDDKAVFRRQECFDRLMEERRDLDRWAKTGPEEIAERHQINYVALRGNIGMIADGAGTGMLTLDMIRDAGGSAADFCEMGGLSNAEVMERAMEAVLSDDRVRVLVISLIGGLTRMDHLADGILGFLKKRPRTVPIFIRMCGTGADAGIPMLRDAGLPVEEDLALTVRKAVEAAGEM